MSGQAQDGTSTRPVRRRDVVRAVNRCLIMVYECDRKQPVPERLTQLLAELWHRARAETIAASKRRAADDD
jgi:hypothetical protein